MDQEMRLPPAPDIPGPVTPDDLMGQQDGGGIIQSPSPEMVQAALSSSTKSDLPVIEQGEDLYVELPTGFLTEDDRLITKVRVRELVGYDEEKLSRINSVENPAKYISRMLELAVEDLDGAKPTHKQIRSLLMGDRDALVLGIRRATYGQNYEFNFTCPSCEHESHVVIDLVDDIPLKNEVDDPHQRDFVLEGTRHGIKMKMIDGAAQEAFSQEIQKKTPAELTTVMLAHCVLAIDGNPVKGRERDVLALSTHDRDKATDFLRERQPGPKLDEIPVHCATCEEEFPIPLGLGDLFRF